MPGSVVVDFAGTTAEAKAYAAQHGGNIRWNPQHTHHSRAANGTVALAIKWTTKEELVAAVAKFASLEWDEDSQFVMAAQFTGERMTPADARNRGLM